MTASATASNCGSDVLALVDHDVLGALQHAHAALLHELAVDRTQLARERGPGGHAQHRRLAVHGAAGADDGVGRPHQRGPVDGRSGMITPGASAND